MRALTVAVALNLFSLLATSQGIDNLWLTGYDSYAGIPYGGSQLDFSSGGLHISYQNRQTNLAATYGAIADSLGQLRFVSNGIFIQNAANDTMQNGSGLNPSAYTSISITNRSGLNVIQGNLVIPMPGSASKYYLFHLTCDDAYTSTNTWCSKYLYYSVIDMSLDGGLGAVTQKNVVLLSESLVCGRLTAARHANGRDWWLISHKANSNIYYKHLITPMGITGPYSQSIGGVYETLAGQCVFSPDGLLYANYEWSLYQVDIFEFDRCSGLFTMKAQVQLDDSMGAGGVAFSSNSKVLYVSSILYMYQFDMDAADIAASKTTIGTWDGFYSPTPPFGTTFLFCHLAPDGRIYVNCGNGTLDLHVINYPDSLGMSCNFCQHCIHLPTFNSFTIPNYPNYFLGEESGSICDSLQTGADEIISFKNALLVYPNPLSGTQLTLSYPSVPQESKVQIFGSDGQLVFSSTLPLFSVLQVLDIPRLSTGLYLARWTGGSIVLDAKFLVK